MFSRTGEITGFQIHIKFPASGIDCVPERFQVHVAFSDHRIGKIFAAAFQIVVFLRPVGNLPVFQVEVHHIIFQNRICV